MSKSPLDPLFLILRRTREGFRESMIFLFDPMEERVRLPGQSPTNPWRQLGGIVLALFVIQTITGILLSFYYHPSPEMAWPSIKQILTDVSFGRTLHSIHHWAAQGMLVITLLHLLRVFASASFKAPREFTWIIGILMLLLAVAFDFTGRLLPWDNQAYWMSVAGTELLGRIPLFGKTLMEIARGGDEVGASTLSRFYSMHILVLPWLFFYLMVFHAFLARKHGMSDNAEGK